MAVVAVRLVIVVGADAGVAIVVVIVIIGVGKTVVVSFCVESTTEAEVVYFVVKGDNALAAVE